MNQGDIEQLKKLGQCRNCLGRGELYPQCGFCADSTHDHECPSEVTCPVCKGTGRIGAVDRAIGELNTIRSTLAALLRVPEDSDTAAGFVARLVADRGAIAAAYLRDRAGQYNPGNSEAFAALLGVAAELASGRHLAAHAHGELDDLLAAPGAPITQPEAPATVRGAS